MAASMSDTSKVAMGCWPSMAVCAVVLGVGCGGAGVYGHAPSYAPIDDEATLVAVAREYDAAAARSQGPEGWRKAVALFGVVESRAAGPGGQALLKLSVRTLAPQNACERPGDDDSCRVTVSEKDEGGVWVLVRLRGDDDFGPLAVGQRSLVRIVGAIGQDVSPTDGAPVVHASWYRHFPATQYVSKNAR
jgi:hypothetical protein